MSSRKCLLGCECGHFKKLSGDFSVFTHFSHNSTDRY